MSISKLAVVVFAGVLSSVAFAAGQASATNPAQSEATPNQAIQGTQVAENDANSKADAKEDAHEKGNMHHEKSNKHHEKKHHKDAAASHTPATTTAQ